MVPSTLIRPADAEQQASIAAIADHFAIEGDFIEGREIVSGHINSTFRVTFGKPDGTRQRYIEAFEQLTAIPFDKYLANPSVVLS